MYKLKIELWNGGFHESDAINDVSAEDITDLVHKAATGELGYLRFKQNGHTVVISNKALEGCVITIVNQPVSFYESDA